MAAELTTAWGDFAVAMAGAAWSLRVATSAALARLVSVLQVGVVAGVAWCTTIVAEDLLSWSGDDVAVAVGLTTVATALPLYLTRRHALPQLALLASLATLLVTIS